MKTYLLPLLVLLAAAQAAVAADSTINKRVTVTASVPAGTFIVSDEGSWMNQPQVIGLDDSGALTPVVNRLYLKSSIGPISATLDSAPTMTSGADNIPLTMAIGGTTLSTTTKQIVAASDATNGSWLEASIGATQGTYNAGNYRGYVYVTFETTAP
ncbi:CS1 type fimbrial major subunit [Pseudomonas typographi]|uniref:Adhesin n=1 Tax=Pseudomonas typographi TaxID=2715964 RepID=A0ABR7Z7V9_9PSED|nr:CS1 type fimbrial major subunit [Pseudomonas typographi]MBD1551908.1 adhesin [Pseudomonas typographi]MBD1589859.1 adhesin [Pseudomonas typographi]MBD1601545.1 adhesin [Pseudomonas typographi]